MEGARRHPDAGRERCGADNRGCIGRAATETAADLAQCGSGDHRRHPLLHAGKAGRRRSGQPCPRDSARDAPACGVTGADEARDCARRDGREDEYQYANGQLVTLIKKNPIKNFIIRYVP